MADVLDLLAAREPLSPVRFPNGKEFAVRESDGFVEQLLESAAGEQSSEKFEQAWQYLVPGATADDFAYLTTQDYGRILDHCRTNVKRTLELVAANRKNANGGTTALGRPIPPSSPTAASSASSPESPAPSGETGSSSAPSPIGKPSSRMTRSKKSNASTPSSTTSTP